jgi:hypothetical protein
MLFKEGDMKYAKTKIAASVISIFILIALFFVGNAQALILGFSVMNNFPMMGEDVDLMVSVEIESGEVLDVKNFTLMLSGPDNVTCLFLPNGTVISGCSGVTIVVVQTAPFNFSYGFEEGLLKYNITLETGALSSGAYSAKFIVTTGFDSFTSSEEQIVVVEALSAAERCSLRAVDGEVILEGIEFEYAFDRMSFALPKLGAVNGKGEFYAQGDGERLSYKFTIEDAIDTTGDLLILDVSGKIQLKWEEAMEEQAVIIYDKNSGELHLIGDLLEINGMDVTRANC